MGHPKTDTIKYLHCRLLQQIDAGTVPRGKSQSKGEKREIDQATIEMNIATRSLFFLNPRRPGYVNALAGLHACYSAFTQPQRNKD